jgi:multiple sugar transport system substrate-binding protein
MQSLPQTLQILFLASTLLLAGCLRPPSAEKELVYSFWGSLEQQKADRKIIEEFEKENPGIKVKMLPIGQRYMEKVQAMLLGAVAPDIMMVDISYYDRWMQRGVLMDITDTISEIASEDPLMHLPRRAFERSHRFYGAPLNVHGLVLCVNRDALKAAGIPYNPSGWTWEEIREMAPALSRRNGNPKATTDYALLMPSAEVLFAAYGADLFDSRDHPTRATADTPEAQAAFTFYRDLFTSGYAVPPDVKDDQGTYQLFRDGRIAFFFCGRWLMPEIAGRAKFDWDIVPVPAGPAGSNTLHGGTGLAIWKDTPHPDEAKRFLKYYAGRKGSAVAMQSGRYVPVYEKLAYSPEFQALRPEALTRLSDTMREGAASIFLYRPGYTDVRRLFLRRAEQMIYRNATPEQVLKGLQRDLERWLQRQNAAASASTTSKAAASAKVQPLVSPE